MKLGLYMILLDLPQWCPWWQWWKCQCCRWQYTENYSDGSAVRDSAGNVSAVGDSMLKITVMAVLEMSVLSVSVYWKLQWQCWKCQCSRWQYTENRSDGSAVRDSAGNNSAVCDNTGNYTAFLGRAVNDSAVRKSAGNVHAVGDSARDVNAVRNSAANDIAGLVYQNKPSKESILKKSKLV